MLLSIDKKVLITVTIEVSTGKFRWLFKRVNKLKKKERHSHVTSTVSVRRTCLMRCSRSRLRRHVKDYDRLLPRTM